MNDLIHLQKRVDRHDERLRLVEQSLSILPRIEKKIDKIAESDHSATLAVMREQASARSREISALKGQIETLQEKSTQHTEKFWKIAIVIALILGALQGLGVDLSSALPL